MNHINATPLGTYEKAKACEYRESQACSRNVKNAEKIPDPQRAVYDACARGATTARI